jgi:sulfur-carrier protein
VAEVLRALDAEHPGTWDRVCEAGPRVRVHMNVFVDGVRADLATPVGEASVVHVIPAVSGG